MLLGPVRSFSRSRFLISSILDPFRLNFGLLGRAQCFVFLQDRECSSSATRKFSPNPSYLRSGELVLPWDTKNRSSHTQIVHIDILRAQMYLKSAIWAQGPKGPMGPWAHGPLDPALLNFFSETKLEIPREFLNWWGSDLEIQGVESQDFVFWAFDPPPNGKFPGNFPFDFRKKV